MEKQSGDDSQSEWQAQETGLDAGGDGKPLEVSERGRDLHTVRPWQRKAMVITIKERGRHRPDQQGWEE